MFLRKKYQINRRQQNLMDIKFHFLYGFTMFFIFCGHQIKNIFLEIFYEEIGIEIILKIFLNIYMIENIGIYAATSLNNINTFCFFSRKIADQYHYLYFGHEKTSRICWI